MNIYTLNTLNGDCTYIKTIETTPQKIFYKCFRNLLPQTSAFFLKGTRGRYLWLQKEF